MLSGLLSLRLLRPLISFIIFVALAALVVLGGRSWLASHDADVRLASTLAAQKTILDQAAAREQRRDATLSKTMSAISRAKRSVQTPAEAAARIPDVLPPLPQPISLTVPQPTAAEPMPPASAIVPQADLKPLYDSLQDCRACQAQLSAAQADVADGRAQIAALTAERDAAVKAARGGGFWSRTRRAAKWFLIGAAAGAFAAAAAHR